MSTYTDIWLEKGSTVVAYFAPNFKQEFPMVNDLKVYRRPRGNLTKFKDFQLWDMSVVLQGIFETSDNLPADHKAALIALFGKDPVTARDQVNRIRSFAVNSPGAFNLFIGTDRFTATAVGGVDLAAGMFPTVAIREIRPPKPAGVSRIDYLIRFIVGFEI